MLEKVSVLMYPSRRTKYHSLTYLNSRSYILLKRVAFEVFKLLSSSEEGGETNQPVVKILSVGETTVEIEKMGHSQGVTTFGTP